ncbi:MAG: cache domain-containing protein [Spirochaetota bacterium]
MILKKKEVPEFAKIRKKYDIVNPEEPNLYREVFPYDKVCMIPFDNTILPIIPAEKFRICDTTFRDGQQARPPYTVEQISTIFDYLNRLSGPQGLISQCEFFIYTDKDREAVEECRAKAYKYPRITSWIRANIKDFEIVKQTGLDETGILTSVSDYQIYLKLNKTRTEAAEEYLKIVYAALEENIIPRLHFEDITRADIYGFVVPFVQQLVRISEDSKKQIKIRLCDTMGYGVTYPMAALPRSVPRLIRALIDDAGMSGGNLQWHGHNDFHRGFTNASYAWLYGCETVDSTLLGFGERTGNTPLEAMVIEYVALTGDDEGIDLTAITDMAHYMESIGFEIPANYPFVGADFNVTRAGIHVDGLIKNEEIYNIFNTEKLLKRPLGISIADKSGTAGIAKWLNSHLGLTGDQAIQKKDPGVARMHREIIKQYDNGRSTSMSNEELEKLARKHLPAYFVSDFDRIKSRENKFAAALLEKYLEHPDILSMVHDRQESILQELIDKDPFIRFAYVVNPEGKKITKNITQITDKSKYNKELIDTDYSDRDWFINVMETGDIYVSNIFTSKITGKLMITVSGPLTDEEGKIIGILGLDIGFEDFAKIEEEGDV